MSEKTDAATNSPANDNAIDQVLEDMHVVAANGDSLGKVKFVKMGDPEAITSDGQSAGEQQGPIAEFLADAFSAGPEISQEQAERLLRLGYLRVDAKGLGSDTYWAADRVDRVEGDTVHLKD